MAASIESTVYEAVVNADMKALLEYPLTSIRPFLPCLTRMQFCSSLDKSAIWEEKLKSLMQLLSEMEAVNDIIALLSIDFHALETNARIEIKHYSKLLNSGGTLSSEQHRNGPILEFERCEPFRKLQIVLSELLVVSMKISTASDKNKRPILDECGYATSSELFSCSSYLEIVSDVLCILYAELPTLLELQDLAEALLYVPNGELMLCKLVANNPDSLLPVCRHIVRNHRNENEKDCYKTVEERRHDALYRICGMCIHIPLTIRSYTVKNCYLASLAIALTHNPVVNRLKFDWNVSELVTFISGLLLGSDTRIRSWLATHIKTNQEEGDTSNRLLQEIESELRLLIEGSEIKQPLSLLDESKQGAETELETMCLLNEEQCLRASTLIRLCCAVKTMSGLRFSEVKSDLVLRLITCFPPLTAAGIRLISLSLSMLLACSALITGEKKEKCAVNWIKWLASKSSELQNAGPEGGSFAEQLLLIAIHFHNDQRQSVIQLACSNLGMRVKVNTSSLVKIQHIFTEEVFTTKVVAAHAVTVPVTIALNASMSGYLPIHCVYQLLKSRSFSKSQVSIKEWIYKQICSAAYPLHPQLPSLVSQYISTIVTPHGNTEGMRNDPLTEDEIMTVFKRSSSVQNSEKYSFTAKILLLYYVLLYEESVLSNMRSLILLPNPPKRYSSDLINSIPIKSLLHKAQLDPWVLNRLYPALLGLLVTQFPNLCQVEDWLSELDSGVFGNSENELTTSCHPFSICNNSKNLEHCSPGLLKRGLLHSDVNPALALMHLRTLNLSWYSARRTRPFARSLTSGLSKLLESDVSRRVRQESCKLWLKINTVTPCKLWVLTCNALRPDCNGTKKLQEITLNMLTNDPLVILALDERIFRCPEILSIVLRMTRACLALSRVHFTSLALAHPTVNANANPAIPLQGSTASSTISDAEKEELANALISAQDSAVLQILIEVCLPNSDDFKDLEMSSMQKKATPYELDVSCNFLTSLREVHCLVCSSLHQVFIANTSVAKLVHFQTYPYKLIEVLVSGVPSMHICMDFIPELLQFRDPWKQVFALQLTSHIAVQYPLAKSFSLARLCLNVFTTLITVMPSYQHCQFVELVLTSLLRFAGAFPPLLKDCINILLHLSRVSYCQVSTREPIFTRRIDTDHLKDEGLADELNDNMKIRLYWEVRNTFRKLITDAIQNTAK